MPRRARAELGRERLRVGGHEAPVAELGPRVAGGGNFIEHLRARRTALHPIEFEDAPGEAQADQRRVSARHQRVDLGRRLDVAGAMMVKHGAQTGRGANRRRDNDEA